MLKVKYKAAVKAKIPVHLPIGAKTRSETKEIKWLAINEHLELSDADAKALVALDSHNFEIVEEVKVSKK